MIMEAKFNIAEILKDKPQGTKLYDWLYNRDVELDTISTTDTETEVWCTNKTDNNTICHRAYSEFGTVRGCTDGLQILLPSKEMRDWSKFAWKRGDVLVSNNGSEVLFEKFNNDEYTEFTGRYVLNLGDTVYSDTDALKTQDFKALHDGDKVKDYIAVVEKLFGGKLNRETLEIDPVKSKHVFKPLEYVLSNDNEDKEWTLCQFSHFDKKGNAVFVGGSYADKGKVILHYEGNEHLLGTTNSLE